VISPGSTLLCAASIDPNVLQVIASGLLSAEPDLVIASLALASTIRQVLEGDLLSIRSPCVRKDGIWRNVVDKIFGQAEVAITFPL
jgi:hypothetical protein